MTIHSDALAILCLLCHMTRTHGQLTSTSMNPNCLEDQFQKLDERINQLEVSVKQLKEKLVAPVCPANFTYLPSSNKCYRLEHDKLEWEVARLRCKRLHPDAHLIVVDDDLEQAAVVTYLTDLRGEVQQFCSLTPEFMAIWTAGQRINPLTKSTFVWKPDNSNWKEMMYTNGNLNEPNYAMSVEACVHFAIFPSMTWNDVACGDGNLDPAYPVKATHMCPLCELDLSQ